MGGNDYFLWEKVCRIALRFPGTVEKIAYGTPALYVEKKLFARLKEDRETLALYNDERNEWIARNADTFFITAHYKNYPMMLIDLKAASPEDLETLLQHSWKMRASKKLLNNKGN